MRIAVLALALAACAATPALGQSCFTSYQKQSFRSEIAQADERLAENAFSESIARHPMATIAVLAAGGGAAGWVGSLIEEDEFQDYQAALFVAMLMGAAFCSDNDVNSRACSNVLGIFGGAFAQHQVLMQQLGRVEAAPLCR